MSVIRRNGRRYKLIVKTSEGADKDQGGKHEGDSQRAPKQTHRWERRHHCNTPREVTAGGVMGEFREDVSGKRMCCLRLGRVLTAGTGLMSRPSTDNEWEKRNPWRAFSCERLTGIWHIMQKETIRHECVEPPFAQEREDCLSLAPLYALSDTSTLPSIMLQMCDMIGCLAAK